MIKVGSRDSRLAVVQAEEVMRRLGECKLVTMKTTGDKILDRTLDKVGGKGLFVKELDRALAAGEVDLTVHSLKDVPMEQPDGLPLHIGEDLIHVQREIRQMLPVRRAAGG